MGFHRCCFVALVGPQQGSDLSLESMPFIIRLSHCFSSNLEIGFQSFDLFRLAFMEGRFDHGNLNEAKNCYSLVARCAIHFTLASCSVNVNQFV